MENKLIRELFLNKDNFKNEQEIWDYLKTKGITPGRFYSEIEMTDEYVEARIDITTRSTELHSHDFYEIMCVQKTNIEYLMGSERFILKQGDILLIPPGISHQPLMKKENPIYERYVLWLSTKFVNKLLQIDSSFSFETHQYRLINPNDNGRMLREFKDIASIEKQERNCKSIELYGKTMNILAEIDHLCKDVPVIHSQRHELFDNIMNYLESNFQKKITVSDIAKQFYISDSTLSHLFKEESGYSFHSVLNSRRLIEAKKLFCEGYKPNAVYSMIGFEDYSNFYKSFQKSYGISPRDYIKMISQKNQ